MAFNLAVFLSKSVPGVGVLGGVVGGSAALAKNIHAHRKGKISRKDAAIDTGKETVGAGVATAFSAYTAGVVGGGLALSLGTAFAAAVVGKYAWDRGVELVEDKINGETLEQDMMSWGEDNLAQNEADDSDVIPAQEVILAPAPDEDDPVEAATDASMQADIQPEEGEESGPIH